MSIKESKGKCKYCHLSGHVIDKCPTIICKHCKAIGHPNWLCKSNPNAENVKSPLSPNLRNKKSIYAFDSTHSLSKSQSQTQLQLQNSDSTMCEENKESIISSKPVEVNNNYKLSILKENSKEVKNNQKNQYIGFKDDFKEKKNEINEEEIKEKIINLQYYQKMIELKWGDLIQTF
jgi:hypothetical protein